MDVMKRNLVLFAILLLVASPARGGQWRLGPQFGTSISSLSGDTPANISMGKSTGFAAGLIGEFRLAEDVWLSLQPMYFQRGASTKISVSGQAEPLEGPSLSLDYLVVPILARIMAGNERTYVVGGVNPGFLLDSTWHDGSTSEDLSSAFNSFDLAASIGFGMLVPVGQPTLSLEFRYEQSILNLASSGREEQDDGLPARFRSKGFQLMAGLLWPLGGM